MAREAVLVAGARTAVGRAGRGTLKNYRAEDMAAEAQREQTAKVAGHQETTKTVKVL